MKIVLAACCAAVLAAALTAQVPPAQQKPTFRAGVNFVRVDVYPTLDGRIVADLKKEDFEVLEDGVLQRIETFDQVVARAPGLEFERAEPRSAAESNEAAADPRNRLFVLFFDTLHGSGFSQAEVGRALAKFLDQLIGPDDLIGVMRPEMPVDTLSFTRRPSSFTEFLLTGAEWQKRWLQREMDDTERMYQICYPPGSPDEDFPPKMIARRRELLAIGGLQSLVTHLAGLREGRKAVLVVSEGWMLFTKDDSLARPSSVRGVPGAPPIGVDRGKPTVGDPRRSPYLDQCERDRLLLARIDNERDFRRMLDDANRSNVTFYPIDPRGLTVASSMNRRPDSLITLATATDGIAVVNSNDFAPGLKRVADDLSSYYLLGYYSTNAKADGTFRKITVRVKRPRVAVRARRGYLAATEADVAARARAEQPPDPQAQLRAEALGAVAAVRRDRQVHLDAGYAWDVSGPGKPRHAVVWLAGEIDLEAGRSMPWSSGADATITVTTAATRQPVTTAQAELPALRPRLLLRRLFDVPPEGGDFVVQVRVKPKIGNEPDAAETLRVTVPAATEGLLEGRPLLFRRGPFTGAGFQPTADVRFRKAERFRADFPLAGACDSVSGRLLDRKGQVLEIPVAASAREDEAVRFLSAEVVLAPLAQGDYLLEVSAVGQGRTEKKLIAFRVVP